MSKKSIADPLNFKKSLLPNLKLESGKSYKLSKITTNSDLVKLVGVSKELKDPFRLKEIIGKSPLLEFSKMYKQVSVFDQILKPIPGMSDKSFLSTFPSLNFPNIIIPRPSVDSISPLVPEERRTPSTETDSTTITDEVYEERIPSEQRSVPLPDLDHRKIVYKVLIVGGIAEGTNQIVARFIKQLGFEVIILSEQPDGRRTRFQKFEAYTNVDFAITLLTPDDVGGAKDNPYELKLRPSQDTIFELAYLCQQLRPEQVFTLYTEEIELPSHLEGWMHVPMCNGDGWKLKLVREMQFAGLCVDKNKLL